MFKAYRYWVAVIGLAALAACTDRPPSAALSAAPIAVQASPIASPPEAPAPDSARFAANPASFAEWLAAFRTEAEGHGFKPETLAALDALQPIQRIIDLDRKQPEGVATLNDYLASHVTPRRIAQGRETLARDGALLSRVAQRYGVPPRIILAVIGLETDYGRQSGGFSVLSALSTLAYDGRRPAYFRKELIHALEIIDAGDIDSQAMRGSWAGAMGQVQFMPSNYLKYAVDFEGAGRRDIWTNKADVYGSIAHYLAENGWHGDDGWGREVALPDGFDTSLAGMENLRSLGAWRKLGIKSIDGKALPRTAQLAALILPPRGDGRSFLVHDNYRAIRTYNPSHFYALAVAQLADAIGK